MQMQVAERGRSERVRIREQSLDKESAVVGLLAYLCSSLHQSLNPILNY